MIEREAIREHLAASGVVEADGTFEILAISAGEGNGWQFSAAALRESVGLWEGAEVFIDHHWYVKSVRDLAGVLHSTRFDEARQGVVGKLRPVGPSAALLTELGRQMVADAVADAGAGAGAGGALARPRVGFSADVLFTAQGRSVQKILRVNSVDLVFNPARGGAFLRALNSVQMGGMFAMETVDSNTAAQGSHAPVGQMAGSQPAGGQPFGGASTGAEGDAVRAAMCEHLLETALGAARLPGAVNERIRKQFGGKVFAPAALQSAIDDARALVSELTGAGVVQGVGGAAQGRISGMFSSEDQYSAALFDLIGAERPEELKGARTARLSGIRELYTLMTGDVDFAGGYHPERVQFANSANLPGVLKNAMNKLIVQEWQELGRSGYRWWEPVVSVEHFTNLHQITGVLVGEVAVLPSVAEGGAYTELAVADSAEVGSWGKYGGYVGLTLEMFERDETHKLRQYPRKLASAGLRRISGLVGSIFTANAGAGPQMTDGINVFAAGHSNLGTAALSSAAWEAASSAIYNQPMLQSGGGGPKQALDAKYCIVPRALRLTAMQILYPNCERSASIFSENMQRGEQGDVITCPEFADSTDWAAIADPRLAPGIIVGERFGLLPEIIVADGERHGALFTNDEIRMKARHWVAVFVADHRPLYKANVAGA